MSEIRNRGQIIDLMVFPLWIPHRQIDDLNFSNSNYSSERQVMRTICDHERELELLQVGKGGKSAEVCRWVI